MITTEQQAEIFSYLSEYYFQKNKLILTAEHYQMVLILIEQEPYKTTSEIINQAIDTINDYEINKYYKKGGE